MFRSKDKKQRSRLATQIRISYIILLLPSVAFMVFAFYNMWQINERNNSMLNSVVKASEFSLEFKEDFDYETYLLIVGNVSPDETNLPQRLSDARGVVDSLKQYTDTEDNRKRLQYAEKYLNNLETYIKKIEDNLAYEDRYDDNMIIWENDVQIVTSLLQETINEYIYYENRQIQITQAENNELFIDIVEMSVGILAFSLVSMTIVSYIGPIWITRPIEEQVKKEQKMLRKSEFDLLQSQINPHFLYNTLDAIIWSAEAGNQKQVVNMVGNLSDFFRLSLNKGKETVTVREELQHVKSYLEIQQIRYQDILDFEISVNEELNSFKIPKLTVQPVVENALYHGIKNKRGGGKITVSGKANEEDFVIIVEDNGKGMTEERLAEVKRGIEEGSTDRNVVYGLYNVNERIKLNYGEEYGITVKSFFDKGTRVEIKLPKKST